MAQQNAVTIGRRYNTTLTRNEGIYGLSIAESRLEQLRAEGVRVETLTELRERITQLAPLEQLQVSTELRSEKLTDQLNSLIDRSIGLISTTYNLASVALGQEDPAALESLPARSNSHTVKLQTLALLECAAFVREHAEAFATAQVGPAFAGELDALSEAITTTDGAQEKSRVTADDARKALFLCRGSIYLTCKQIYSAGRNAFRKQPEVRSLFAFQHMKKATTSSSQESEEAKLLRRETRALLVEEKKHATEAKLLATEEKRQTVVTRREEIEVQRMGIQAKRQELESKGKEQEPKRLMLEARSSASSSTVPSLTPSASKAAGVSSSTVPSLTPSDSKVADIGGDTKPGGSTPTRPVSGLTNGSMPLPRSASLNGGNPTPPVDPEAMSGGM